MSAEWNNEPVPSEQQVTVLVVGPADRDTAWTTQLHTDERIRVVSFATDPEDLKYKLASYNPDALVIDARIFSGPGPLSQFLTGVQAAAYVVVPPGTDEAAVASLRQLQAVTDVYVGDLPGAQFPKKLVQDVAVIRRQAPTAPQVWTQPSGVSAGGIRVIAVWNRVGGSGKSTLAAALALEASQRGLKTLLVGLSAPDLSLPLMLNLKVAPNLSSWLLKPSLEEGINAGIQKAGDLDVIVGLQDALRERDLLVRPDDPSSLGSLAVTATYAGYAVVIFDVPAYGAYPAAIAASNTWVVPALPTIDHAALTASAYELVFKKLAGTHKVSAGNVLVVLNRARGDLMNPRDWQEAGETYLRAAHMGAFPPVATAIPETASVPAALNNGRSPLAAGDAFATQIHKLNDLLLGAPAQQRASGHFGPFRVRKGG
mgnify:CR=1 FL=1